MPTPAIPTPPVAPPAMSDPVSPGQPLKLTPNETAAVDPKFQSQHPGLAAMWRHKPYDTMTRSLPYQAGNWLNSNFKGMVNHIAPLFQQGAGRGALAGGGMGLLAGFLGDKAMQYFTGKDPGMTWKLGLLGAGLGGYAGYQKKAFNMNNTQINPRLLGVLFSIKSSSMDKDALSLLGRGAQWAMRAIPKIVGGARAALPAMSKGETAASNLMSDGLGSLRRAGSHIIGEARAAAGTARGSLARNDLAGSLRDFRSRDWSPNSGTYAKFDSGGKLLLPKGPAVPSKTKSVFELGLEPDPAYRGPGGWWHGGGDVAQSMAPFRSGFKSAMQNKSLTKVAAAMVAALNHTDAQETRIALHTDASLHKSAEAAQGVMEKVAFQIAADAYASAAKMHTPEYHLFTKFAEMRRWSNDLQPYSDCVLSALGRNARYRQDHEAAERSFITKGATVAEALATIAKAAPGVARAGIRGTLLTGAAAGTGAGALYWLANRHVKEDDNENEATRQKVDYYKNLTADISAQLKNKGLVAA